MALRHYQGSTPTASGPWLCPSCGEQNTTAVVDGCTVCGAGADARKVGGPVVIQASSAVGPSEIPLVGPRLIGETDADHAFYTWMLNEHSFQHAQASEADGLKEAFMAGIAWAQGRETSEVITDKRLLNEVPPSAALAFYAAQVGEVPELLEGPAFTTILAALAFYRDNVLGYGALPGQLSAEQVTELIARLTPEEPKS